MCQSKEEGGRRCSNINNLQYFLNTLEPITKTGEKQAHKIFSKLCEEFRTNPSRHLTEMEKLQSKTIASLTDWDEMSKDDMELQIAEWYNEEAVKAMYAFPSRLLDYKQRLNKQFKYMSESTGIAESNISEIFDNECEEIFKNGAQKTVSLEALQALPFYNEKDNRIDEVLTVYPEACQAIINTYATIKKHVSTTNMGTMHIATVDVSSKSSSLQTLEYQKDLQVLKVVTKPGIESLYRNVNLREWNGLFSSVDENRIDASYQTFRHIFMYQNMSDRQALESLTGFRCSGCGRFTSPSTTHVCAALNYINLGGSLTSTQRALSETHNPAYPQDEHGELLTDIEIYTTKVLTEEDEEQIQTNLIPNLIGPTSEPGVTKILTNPNNNTILTLDGQYTPGIDDTVEVNSVLDTRVALLREVPLDVFIKENPTEFFISPAYKLMLERFLQAKVGDYEIEEYVENLTFVRHPESPDMVHIYIQRPSSIPNDVYLNLNDRLDAYTTLFQNVENGTALIVEESNSQYFGYSSYLIDRNTRETEVNALQTKLPSRESLLTAFASGKTVTIPLNAIYRNTDADFMTQLDPQGYITQNIGRQSPRHGYITLALNEHGTIVPVSSRNLTTECSCVSGFGIETKNQLCEHVDKAYRLYPRIVQTYLGIVPKPNDSNIILQGASVWEERNPSEYFIQGGTEMLKRRKYNPIFSYEEIYNNDVANAQRVSAQFNQNLTYSYPHIPDSIFKEDKTDTSVEIPFSVQDENTGNIIISTMLNIAKDKDNHFYFTPRDLKCECEEYKQYYRCHHLKYTVDALHRELKKQYNILDTTEYVDPHEADKQKETLNNIAGLGYDLTLAPEGQSKEETISQYMARMNSANETREKIRIERGNRIDDETKTSDNIHPHTTATLQRWENVESGYTENPEAFFQDYQNTRRRKRNKEAILEPIHEDGVGAVTDNICAPGGRGFGIEIEFDFDESLGHQEQFAQGKKIAEELHSLGILDEPEQQEYHTNSDEGYTKWTFEEDSSVTGGELVSPIMHDTPEDWEKVRVILEVVKKHGGVATTHNGLHVNIGNESYQSKPQMIAEVIRTTKKYEETLYRISSSPFSKNGQHRQLRYCVPQERDTLGTIVNNPNPAYVWDTLIQLGADGGYSSVVAKGSEESSRLEMRLWDATLDLGVIQRQVAVSAAIVDAAERQAVTAGNISKPLAVAPQILGGYCQAEKEILRSAGRRFHNKETLAESSKEAISFMDTMFRTHKQRKQVMELFTTTNWINRRFVPNSAD